MTERTTTTPLGPLQTTTLYAFVNMPGRLIRGMGAKHAVKDGEGLYRVTFNVDVSLGAFNVTPYYGGGDGYRFAEAEGDPDDSNTVIVRTAKPEGSGSNNRDSGFYLTVTTAYGDQDMMTGTSPPSQ